MLNSKKEGIEISRLSGSKLHEIRGREIGFIFQDPMTSLNPSMRCGKQVLEILKRHRIECEGSYRNEVLRLFDKVKLPDVEKAFRSYPHELSGGQRQRIMIAMAVACKPKLLIADEPTTALDLSVQSKIIELINSLRKSEGLGVLFISHDLDVIGHIADRISIMYRGRVIESGMKKNVLESPGEPYTTGLLACKPPMDKKLRRLPTVSEFSTDPDGAREKLNVVETSIKRSKTIMTVRDLDVYFTLDRNLLGRVNKEFNVLKNVGFDLYEGESLGLVGESGSGKSTLGRALLNLIEARSGRIDFREKVISGLSKRDFRRYRRKIQFVFQDPYSALNPKIKVGEAIEEPLSVHHIVRSGFERRKKVEELLEKVGLSIEDYNKFPHQFSGGQRQRIAIARALILNPEVLICDEAVSALDVSVQAQILNLLKDLKDTFGLTYLFITHDMSVVRFFCDRVLVMKDGEIIERGNVDDLFRSPSHPYTSSLLNSVH